MSGGTAIIPVVGLVVGFVIVVFVVVPLLDRYYTNQMSRVSGAIGRIGLNHIKTKFLPGLEEQERIKVLEEIFQPNKVSKQGASGI